MEVSAFGRVAVDRWLRIARMPLDAAAHLLPEGDRRRASALFAIDRADAHVRAVAGGLLNDEVLRDEASRRFAAAGERQRAIALQARADQQKRAAEAHLSANLERAATIREAAERDAQQQRQTAVGTNAQRKQQVKRVAAAKVSEVDQALEEQLTATETRAKRERLKVLEEQATALDRQADAVTARDEAQRLAKAARRAKAARKGTA